MQVLQVKKFNQLQKTKYTEACKAWIPSSGGFPQAAFYFMSTSQGAYRQTGYVAFGYHEAGVARDIAVWRPTKKEAIRAFYHRYDDRENEKYLRNFYAGL